MPYKKHFAFTLLPFILYLFTLERVKAHIFLVCLWEYEQGIIWDALMIKFPHNFTLKLHEILSKNKSVYLVILAPFT